MEPKKLSASAEHLMNDLYSHIWFSTMTGDDRVFIANAPDAEALTVRVCQSWLKETKNNVLIIRHGAAPVKHAWIGGLPMDVHERVMVRSYSDAEAKNDRDLLSDIGLIVLVEDETGLAIKIERIIERVCASRLGRKPLLVISHLPNPAHRRSFANLFTRLLDGKVLGLRNRSGRKDTPSAQPPSNSKVPAPIEHPYYRNFAAASSAARRLKLRKRTRAEYEARCPEDPKLPPNPVEIYPDFERRGGWAMYLTGKRASVDQ